MFKKKLQEMRDVIAGIPEIVLVYLFGSMATGNFNVSSDVDIGIYTGNKVPKEHSGIFKLKMINFFTARLKVDRVDLTIMDYASTVLNFEIIKQNCIIFSRDDSTRVDFEQKTMSFYLDRRYYDLRHAEHFRQRVKEKGLVQT